MQQAEEYINLRLYRIKDSVNVSQVEQDCKFYAKDLERQGDTGNRYVKNNFVHEYC